MKIDFVILWVDGNDPAWLEQKSLYSPKKINYSNANNRFRDWDNLQYWFRGVETFAPWVNNIYFITWGHLPQWLNTDHPKLKIIKHTDYIPGDYLPTFNSDTIETNLYRIKDLSETFVLFNDDVFLTDKVSPEDFFVDGMPCDTFWETIIAGNRPGTRIPHTRLCMSEIINRNFNKREVYKKYFWKCFNLKYGIKNLSSLYLLPFNYFVGFNSPHLACSHLKSTFEKVWSVAGDELHQSCINKFRGFNDVSHWVMRYWNLCNGQFVPRSLKFGRYFEVTDDNDTICSYIKRQKGKMVCINDWYPNINFEKAKSEINSSLNQILPSKSSFEK